MAYDDARYRYALGMSGAHIIFFKFIEHGGARHTGKCRHGEEAECHGRHDEARPVTRTGRRQPSEPDREDHDHQDRAPECWHGLARKYKAHNGF
ncbi:hypothetical protein D9M69_632630 [compost metagenome]